MKDGNGYTFKVVAFFAKDEWFEVRVGETVSMKIMLMRNEWNGVTRAEGRLLEIR